jgi:enolase
MTDFTITDVAARWVLDSRGNPTIEASITADGCTGTALVPSGASTGSREAIELRDNGSSFHGKGVTQAIDHITDAIAPVIANMDVREQTAIDQAMLELDGTDNKARLGANAILAVSLACARAAAACRKEPLYAYLGEDHVLPLPFMNVINGGEHAGNDLAIQEHMVVPVGASSFTQAVQMCSEVYQTLKTVIARRYGPAGINVGDEGGFAPPLTSTEEALDLILRAIEKNGYEDEMRLALDAAATSFYRKGRYELGRWLYPEELLAYYEQLAENYPIVSIEDAFAEDDWEGFIAMTEALGDRLQIVGDDLFVTNEALLRQGIQRGACNALLLKPNQIGTLTESITVAHLCRDNEYRVMVSHRSGDTCDAFIADLAVALGTGQIKAGAPCRGERTAKYNRLMAIEDELGEARLTTLR